LGQILGTSPTKAKLGSSRRTPPFFAGVEGGAAPLAFWIYKIHEPLQWPQAGVWLSGLQENMQADGV